MVNKSLLRGRSPSLPVLRMRIAHLERRRTSNVNNQCHSNHVHVMSHDDRSCHRPLAFVSQIKEYEEEKKEKASRQRIYHLNSQKFPGKLRLLSCIVQISESTIEGYSPPKNMFTTIDAPVLRSDSKLKFIDAKLFPIQALSTF